MAMEEGLCVSIRRFIEIYLSLIGVYVSSRGIYVSIPGVYHLSTKGVFSVSTRSVAEEAHKVWQEVTDSHSVRQDIVDSDLKMKILNI